VRAPPVIFVSGCFDILHPGHVRFLEAAKAQGKTLMVGLNSDESVRKLKGYLPLLDQNARREILLALKFVDEVIIFDDVMPSKLVAEINPHLWLRGADHSTDDDSNFQGIGIAGPPREARYSTTAILKNLQGREFEAVVEKVWGKECWIVNNNLYCAKILQIKPGYACSIHYHKNKTETLTVVSGQCDSEIYKFQENPPKKILDVYRCMEEGHQITLSPNVVHRFSSERGCTILEISTHHEDTDSFRLEPPKKL
jgi:D-glycero-beta-D-manno-heptose 1-phosphate adenylyltransferase